MCFLSILMNLDIDPFFILIDQTKYDYKYFDFFTIQSHDSFITNLREEFQNQAKEIEDKYEKKLKQLRDELDIRRKTEIHEIEERKNQQINTLMRNHEKAFSDIKNYYNDITLNNLSLINTLKVNINIF